MNNMDIPKFLTDLMEARSPSGYEFESQKVIDRYMGDKADVYKKDVMGSRHAYLNEGKTPLVMLSGHMDELGFLIKYIDDKGFAYFDTIGGHDLSMISGRRVTILTKNGPIPGVTGKRAIHLLDSDERNKIPKQYDLWIDLGCKTDKEAQSLVEIGDPVVYDTPNTSIINDKVITGRAFDDKVGTYVVMEVIHRLAAEKSSLECGIVSVASVQEEVGTRGAITSSFSIQPTVGIAIDVGHATDFPSCDQKRFGKVDLGAGPIIARGCNINPVVFEKLIGCAKAAEIPYQIESEPYPTGTDARSIQISRGGVATGLVSIPLRYMHTPTETAHLDDIENTIKLLCAFTKSLTPGDIFEF
ncbi:MAG: M20/M25/M40 family metallo-hydrolase [Puniceicoccales bacterium]|jgi:endoglucanase|nr:M20/M25/M40 family metallo-hydrolase [Puniceicoccales bacterium]